MRRSTVDLGLLFVVLIWGISPTLFVIALGTLQPLAFMMIRFVMLSIISVIVLAVRGWRGGQAWRIRRADIPWLILSALSGYGIYQFLYIVGLAHSTPFAAALLIALVPIFSAFILALGHIEHIVPLQWVGIVLSLFGVAAFLWLAEQHGSAGAEVGGHHLTPGDLLLGNSLLIIAGVLFSIYGIVNKRLASHYSPPELMCYTLLIGTLAITPLSLPVALQQDWSAVPPQVWAIIIYSVFFPIYLTYLVWNWAIGKRGVAYTTLFNYFVPVVSGITAWVILDQSLSFAQIIAGAVVLGGMLLARWAIGRQTHKPALPDPAIEVTPGAAS